MKFKLTISILTLFILAIVIGYHSPLSPSAQAFSTEVAESLLPERTDRLEEINAGRQIFNMFIPMFYNEESGYTSSLLINNLEDSPTAIVITGYIETGEVYFTLMDIIPPNGSATYEQHPEIPNGFRGAIVISSDQKIAAMSTISDTDFVAFATYVGRATGSTNLYMLLLSYAAEDGPMLFSLQNAGSNTANVTISYDNNTTVSAAIPPGAPAYFEVDIESNTLSANITSDQPLVAAVLMSRNRRTFSAYTAIHGGVMTPFFPLLQLENEKTRTKIWLQNIGNQTTQIVLEYMPSLKGVPCEETVLIVPNDIGVFSLGGSDRCTSESFLGSARVKENSTNQPLVGLASQLSGEAGRDLYNAFDASEAMSGVFLPLTMDRNDGWNTTIALQHIGGPPASVTCHFSDTAYQLNAELEVGASLIDSQQNKVRYGYTGSAFCLANNSETKIAAVVIQIGEPDTMVYEGTSVDPLLLPSGYDCSTATQPSQVCKPVEPLNIPPGLVTIHGPTAGRVNTTYTFLAQVKPDGLNPVTHDWQADEQVPITNVGGAADTVSYTWDEPGVYEITVDSFNSAGVVSDVHQITITSEPNNIPPSSVTIIGPTSGTINTTYFFSARVNPDNVTRPFTHNWQADGQIPITQEGGGIDAVTYSWDEPGTYIITLNTSNIGGSVSAVHEITITDPSSPLSIRVDIAGGNLPRFLDDGTFIITFPRLFVRDFSIWVDVPFCADGTAPTAAFLEMITDDTTTTLPMFDFETNTNTYSASIARFEIPVDNSILYVRAVCPSGDQSIRVGAIRLYDPLGRVTDANTGLPIGGAEVTLYHVPGWSPRTSPADSGPNTCESNLSKEADAPWSQPAPIHQGIVVDPVNIHIAPPIPSSSTANDGISDGLYGWDLPQACWYVQVTAPGYQPITSPVVGVPPAVTDLDLILQSELRASITPARTTLRPLQQYIEATLLLSNNRSVPMVIDLSWVSIPNQSVLDLPETVTLDANSEQEFAFTIELLGVHQPGATEAVTVVATAQDNPAIRAESQILIDIASTSPSDFIVGGQIILERRGDNNHSGATVCIGDNCTTTSNDGNYRLVNTPATGTVVITHPSYLSGSYDYSRLDPGPFVTPLVELLGGDINASGAIDIDDAVLVGLAWGSRPEDEQWNAAADITDDGIVDLRDMVAVQFNWGETAQ